MTRRESRLGKSKLGTSAAEPSPLIDGVPDDPQHKMLSTVLSLIRRGDYSHAKDQPATRQLEATLHTRGPSECINDWYSLTARSMIAEVYDQCGEYSKGAALVAEHGERVRDSLRRQALLGALSTLSGHDAKLKFRKLVRARVFMCVQYAVSLYRKDQYAKSKAILEELSDLLEGREAGVMPDWFPWHGPLAVVCYWAGHVCRQQHEFEEARVMFQRAMECFYLSLDRHWKKHAERTDCCPRNTCELCRDRATFANYSVASCMGFGLGWICFGSGELEQATGLLLAARTILRSCGDDIIRVGYANLLLGAVQSAKAGGNGDTVVDCQRAIGLLQDALDRFQKQRHQLYIGRTRHELSLVFILMSQASPGSKEGHLQNAERHNLAALKSAESHSDSEYWCLALLAQSTIQLERGAYEGAVESAIEAEHKSKEASLAHCRVEALISRAEAYSAMTSVPRSDGDRRSSTVKAEHDLQAALRLGGSNPRILALCNLLLARLHARNGDLAASRTCFQQWLRLQKDVQNGRVRLLAKLVAAELYPDDALILHVDKYGDKNVYGLMEEDLRAFLIKRTHEIRPAETAAKLLGISRQAYFNWKKKFDAANR